MAASGRPRITRSGWAGLQPGGRVENARARPDDRGDDEIDAIRAGALDGRPAGARHVALAHVAVPWRERPAVQPDDEKGHDCAPVGVWAAGTGWFARIRPPGSTAALIRRSRRYACSLQKLAGSRWVSARFRYICAAAQGPSAAFTASICARTGAARSGTGTAPAANIEYRASIDDSAPWE